MTTLSTPRWRPIYVAIAALVLAAPLVAMQFTEEVAWTGSDFLVMGALLALLGLAIELVMRLARNARTRFVGAGLAVLAFLWVWAELAVGIFTSWGT